MTVHTRPLVPEDIGRRSGRRPDALSRAATVLALHELQGSHDLPATAKAMFPDDTGIVQVVRAAVNPASTTSVPVLGQTIVGSFLAGLSHRSAAATLFDRAIRVDMAGVSQITFPRQSAAWLPFSLQRARRSLSLKVCSAMRCWARRRSLR